MSLSMTAPRTEDTAQRYALTLADGEITGWRWEAPSAPPLLFLHATGFCASAYRQMLSALAGRYEIYALDLRGHGRNSLPTDKARLRSWSIFRDDVRAFLDREKREGWTLAGHSLGAATALMAAEGRNDVAAIKLVEPVAMPRWLSAAAKTPIWPFVAPRMPLVRLASRRRSEWPDRESIMASYERKALFRSWAPGVLADYLADGLTETPEGVRLSCAPGWEAATFAAQGNDFWKAAPERSPRRKAPRQRGPLPGAVSGTWALLSRSMRPQAISRLCKNLRKWRLSSPLNHDGAENVLPHTP